MLRGTIQKDVTKGGVFGVYQTGAGTTRQLRSTIALNGEYHQGTISREFAYEQTSLSLGSALSLFQSAEVNINRGWRRKAAGKSLELTNAHVNAVCTPVSAMSVTLSYDTRTNVRTYETRTVSDSLFDNRALQGLRGGLNARLPWTMLVGVDGRLRRKNGDLTTAYDYACFWSVANVWRSGVSISARVAEFSNASGNGRQPSLSVSRNLLRSLMITMQAGQDRYDLPASGCHVRANWLRADVDYDIARHVFLSFSGEFNRGKGPNTDRYLLELGIRL